MDADKLRELNDRLLTCGNDYSDVLLDGAAEIERLRDHIRQMMNVPEFARNSMKDQCIAELEAERDALRAENERMREMYANEAHKRNVLQGEWHDLRARVAELARLVESAYAEGFYRAQQGGVDWDNRPNEWKGSQACAALQEGE